MTEIAFIDFETYSEAGFDWVDGNPVPLPGAGQKRSIGLVGAAAYAAHPSTEILMLGYHLPGQPTKLWANLPLAGEPTELLDWVRSGGKVSARNVGFELRIWNIVGKRLGWPELKTHQTVCSMAKAQAWGLPGALANSAKVLETEQQKDTDGKRLIKIFSGPRKPTKSNPASRIRLIDAPEDAGKFMSYCVDDVETEMAINERLPHLTDFERDFWLATMDMNLKGVRIDLDSAKACQRILDQAYSEYDSEMRAVTGGAVEKCTEVQGLIKWLNCEGVHATSLDDESLENLLLDLSLSYTTRRALELRAMCGSASVRKIRTMLNQQVDGRLYDLFRYHGARTGRDAGADTQPQNFPKYQVANVDATLKVMRSFDLPGAEYVCGGNAVKAISGCLRGLFIASEGRQLVSSDYSAIEAVVTAIYACESWRLDSFMRGDDIYLRSASKITGTPYEQYRLHKEQTGENHPGRQNIGKPAELGLGFGGWIGAWRQFDKSDNYDDEQVKRLILDWREASPGIVELWGGQVRGKPWKPDRPELYGLEGLAIRAIHEPDRPHFLSGKPIKGASAFAIDFCYASAQDVLYLTLPSGRRIAYHQPRLAPHGRWGGLLALSYMTWNTNPKMGPKGWVRMGTYGGRLAENLIQATARDIMAHAVVNLHKDGHDVVLRVHDELVVDSATLSVEGLENYMNTMPVWARGWPIAAKGGWCGHRYRKD